MRGKEAAPHHAIIRNINSIIIEKVKMSQNENKEQEKQNGQTEEDTDIVMTHGAADDDEEGDKQVEAVMASTAEVKGATNATKLNKTLKKME